MHHYTNRFCSECRHPYFDPLGATNLKCVCPECKQKQLFKTQGRSASIYPHNVTVRLLDNRQLAVRN